jgi:hypothetical protein
MLHLYGRFVKPHLGTVFKHGTLLEKRSKYVVSTENIPRSAINCFLEMKFIGKT